MPGTLKVLPLVAAILGLAFSGCGGGADESRVAEGCTGGSAEQAYSILKPAVVRITTDIAEGSGFVIGTNQVVTNAHVVELASEVSLEFYRWA